jgi:hypothetical protein
MTDSLNPKAGDEQVPYCLISRDLKKVEGYQFTLRAEKQPGIRADYRRSRSAEVISQD